MQVRFAFLWLMTASLAPAQTIIWERENIDTLPVVNDCNSLALSPAGTPHVVYVRDYSRLMYALKTGTTWQKEIADTGQQYGAYSGLSIALASVGVPHVTALAYDSLARRTNVRYGYRIGARWVMQTIDDMDSCGAMGIGSKHATSLALDTLDYPCIAYPRVNRADSVQLIRYARWNGTRWDTCSIGDSRFWNYGASLSIDRRNHPHMAYYQASSNGLRDTLKYAYHDGAAWRIESVEENVFSGGRYRLSLELDSFGQPHVAYLRDGDLWHAQRDSVRWDTTFVGSIGFSPPAIGLAIDRKDHPHIVPVVELLWKPVYLYWDGYWRYMGWVESDTFCRTFGDASFCLDPNDEPHVAYSYGKRSSVDGIRYAKGMFVGIEEKPEDGSRCGPITLLQNPTRDKVVVRFGRSGPRKVRIAVYDVAGRLVRGAIHKCTLGCRREVVLDVRDLPAGLYFLVVWTGSTLLECHEFVKVR